MKKKNKLFWPGVAFLLAGCAHGPAAAQPLIQTPEAGKEGAPMNDKILSEEEARIKASEFVAGKNWGPPTSVTEDAKSFIVYFATGNKERALLSQRTVIVDKKTGAARYRPRR